MDIAILILMCFRMNAMMKRKNRNSIGYILLLVGCYFGFGFGGAIASIIISGVDPDTAAENDLLFAALPGLLIGYVLGALTAFVIAGLMPVVPKRRRHGDYDDYDDDEDDRPARRRREDPYDYEDRPRRRRRVADDPNEPIRGPDDY